MDLTKCKQVHEYLKERAKERFDRAKLALESVLASEDVPHRGIGFVFEKQRNANSLRTSRLRLNAIDPVLESTPGQPSFR